jgi:hypothetical protein
MLEQFIQRVIFAFCEGEFGGGLAHVTRENLSIQSTNI